MKHKYKYKSLEKKFKSDKDTMSDDEIENLKKEIDEDKALANLYDKKQLPLKILANSWFGSYGAPYIFNWGDTDSANNPASLTGGIQFSNYQEAKDFGLWYAKFIATNWGNGTSIVLIYTSSPSDNGYIFANSSPFFTAYD